MVVLAASLLTKTGKVLVSRQFVDMSRVRIEGLLAAFPKLVGSGRQHTYVETENVRYIYQPLEALYLVLVTNKASNILEDLETLRLLSKVVPEFIHSLDEDSVSKHPFDLLFAFDEVISLGYRENVTVQQVKQNTEMESHEEKLHKMIIQSKINDTKDLMKRKAMEIDKSKQDKVRDTKGMGGFVPSLGSGRSDGELTPSFSKPEPAMPTFSKPAEKERGPSKGMKLGKAKKTNDFLESLRAEGDVVMDADSAPAVVSAGPAAKVVSTDPVSLLIEEKLEVALNKDGGLENMEVQGTISLQVLVEDDAYLRVHLASGDTKGFQFKTHPNIDKALYGNQNILGLKDPERPFPTGSALGILKWRMQTRDEALVPLTINCWPSISGGDSYVNIEYEATADFDLQNVVIAIPLPPLSSAPQVNQIDGDWKYDGRKGLLLWTMELIDSTNRSGSMEFVVPATDSETFFPVEVSFSASHTLCDIKVTSIEGTRTHAPVKYASKTIMSTSLYQVA